MFRSITHTQSEASSIYLFDVNDQPLDFFAAQSMGHQLQVQQVINVLNNSSSASTVGTAFEVVASTTLNRDITSFSLGGNVQAAAVTTVAAPTPAAVIGGTAPQQALRQLWTSADVPTDTLFSQQWNLNNTGQNGGTRGVDIDILPVWHMGLTGRGVNIGVFDTAVDVTHSDLQANVDLSRIITGSMVADHAFVDPTRITSVDSHGTCVAGIICADNNGTGTVGIAYDAHFTPVDILGTQVGNYCWEAARQMYRFDVASNSWGFTSAFTLSALDTSVQYWINGGFDIAAATGRNGLGTIVTLAAGNFRQGNLTTETNGATVDRHAIVVGACDNTGGVSYYSNAGASVLLVAPSSSANVGITTDDVTGSLGMSSGNTTNGFGGTSAATPEIAAIAADLLQGNAGLGWRDVQDILALTARHTGTAINNGISRYESDAWSFNHATNVNGGGMHFSNDYGFGLVDAAAAARLALTWNLVHSTAGTNANEVSATAAYTGPSLDVGHGHTTSISLNITQHESVESMVLDLNNLTFNHANNLTVTLTSPTGTVSQLLTNNGSANSAITSGWELMSREFMGEDAYGTWRITIVDRNGADIGSLSQVHLTAYGSNIANNNIEYFTDEFNTYANATASRCTLATNITAIDAAPITGACNVNLATRVASIDGHALSLGGATVNTVIAGGGDSVLVAGSVAARLIGGQGNDVIAGGSGADYLDGGAGSNTINTGGGADQVVLHRNGLDNIIDFATGIDHLVLSRTEFSAVASRGITSADFISGSASTHVMSGGFVYDRANGNLYYDADGHSALTQIVHLNSNTNLTITDFLLL